MRRDEPLPADFRTNAERPFSLGVRIECYLVLLVAGLAIYAAPEVKQLVLAGALAVNTSALGECRMPSEFEQLHVVVANRGDHYALVDCMHVGTRGAYGTGAK